MPLKRNLNIHPPKMIRLRNVNVFMPESPQKVLGIQITTGLLLVYFYSYSVSTKSLFIALCTACMFINFTSLLIFSLCTNLQQKQGYHRTFSYGFSRFEVITIYSVMLAVFLYCSSITKDCVGRIIFPTKSSSSSSSPSSVLDIDENVFNTPPKVMDIETGVTTNGAFVISLLLFIYQIGATFFFSDLFRYLLSAMLHSGPNLFQESLLRLHQTYSQSKLPHLTRFLLLKINPLFIFTCALLISSIVLFILESFLSQSTADILVFIPLLVTFTFSFLPLIYKSILILTQATPPSLTTQLDQILTEISALESVLEILDHHFWTLSYGSIVGSLHVKVRRDASELSVQTEIAKRFPMVSKMTIQTFKDEQSNWSRSAQLNDQPPTMYHTPSQDVLNKPGDNLNALDSYLQQPQHPQFQHIQPLPPLEPTNTNGPQAQLTQIDPKSLNPVDLNQGYAHGRPQAHSSPTNHVIRDNNPLGNINSEANDSTTNHDNNNQGSLGKAYDL